MAIVTTRTELLEQRKPTGIRTTLIWTVNNGVETKESNITTPLNNAALVSGRALATLADRDLVRRDIRALNDRFDEVA